jgi:predicted flap endonuclease-1-like 5' DNA nuclease
LVDAPVFRPEDFPDRLVTEVTGIGDVSARRLAEKKIENLASLASMRPTELAETLEISEVRAMTFIDEAKTKLINPRSRSGA